MKHLKEKLEHVRAILIVALIMAVVISIFALSFAGCSKAVTLLAEYPPMESVSGSTVSESNATSVQLSTNYFYPDSNFTWLNGSRHVIFSDSLYLVGGDTAYFFGMRLKQTGFGGLASFSQIKLRINGVTIAGSNYDIVSAGDSIIVSLSQGEKPIPLIARDKIALTADINAAIGVIYNLQMFPIDIRKTKITSNSLPFTPVVGVGTNYVKIQ